MDDGFVLPHRVGLERAAGLVDNQEPPSSSGDPLLQPTSSRSRLDLQQLPVLKPIIRRLYIDEGLTFVQVANILKKEYKFNITLVPFFIAPERISTSELGILADERLLRAMPPRRLIGSKLRIHLGSGNSHLC